MIELWEPLTQHFLSLRCPPRILENFFRSEESLVIVSFLHSALSVFKKPLLLLQSTNALFPELADIFKSFKTAIFQRRNSEFYGTKTDKLHWSTKKIKWKVVYNFLAELGVFCTTKIKNETHFSQSGQVFF